MNKLTADMIATIERQRLGFVATVDEDGAPRLSPKGTFVVIDTETLAYGDIRSPGSTDRLKVDPRVEVNFVDPLARKGLRARGKGRFIEKDDATFAVDFARFERWGDLASRIQRIVVIDINWVQPVRTPAYDDGAQEQDLRKTWESILAG